MGYAVVWRENGGEPYAGELSIVPGYVVLSGTASGARESERKLRYEEIVGTHLARSDRLTVVIVGSGGTCVEVASVEGSGALLELAEELEIARGKAAP